MNLTARTKSDLKHLQTDNQTSSSPIQKRLSPKKLSSTLGTSQLNAIKIKQEGDFPSKKGTNPRAIKHHNVSPVQAEIRTDGTFSGLKSTGEEGNTPCLNT